MYDHVNWANQRILETLQSIGKRKSRGEIVYFPISYLVKEFGLSRLQGIRQFTIGGLVRY